MNIFELLNFFQVCEHFFKLIFFSNLQFLFKFVNFFEILIFFKFYEPFKIHEPYFSKFMNLFKFMIIFVFLFLFRKSTINRSTGQLRVAGPVHRSTRCSWAGPQHTVRERQLVCWRRESGLGGLVRAVPWKLIFVQYEYVKFSFEIL